MTLEQLNKPFPITSISRADIKTKRYSQKFIESLNDMDMEYIANKMADAYCECCFWVALENLCDGIIKERLFKKL